MPMRSSCSRMYGTCAAASGVLTVMRTSSEPAMASSFTWIAVPMASCVSVFVIDCTRTGASPPMVTTREPHTARAWRVRCLSGDAASMGRQGSMIFLRLLDFEARDVVLGDGPQVEFLAAHLDVGDVGLADGDGQR